MPRSVLVTGGFGFIGAHVVRELLRCGDRVAVIDRELDGNAAVDVLGEDELAEVDHAASSVPDLQKLAGLLRGSSVTAVVHLASPLATRTEHDPGSVVEEMIAPHRVVLDSCRLAGVERLVWASSVGVFGRVGDYAALPIPNDAAQMPQTVYGAGKSFLERLTDRYATSFGLSALGLRFPLVYGPGRRRGGGQFTTELIEGAALGRRCVVQTADQTNDWMFVGDAARSVVMALDSDHTGALTVTGEVATTREVAEMLGSWFPDAELVLRPGSSDLVAEFDATEALGRIGYEPETPLRRGLLLTANAARERAGLAALAR
jgi:nucleoside-diphosphate-sugar epimerase